MDEALCDALEHKLLVIGQPDVEGGCGGGLEGRMRLTNTMGGSLELHVLGYEFPDLLDDRYDANWLWVEVHCAHIHGAWSAKAPCLLTWEIDNLCHWLEALAQQRDVAPRLHFIEPNLELWLAPDVDLPTIRVYFEAEFRPHWAAWDDGIMRDLWLDFPVADLDLPSAVQALRDTSVRYPVRAT